MPRDPWGEPSPPRLRAPGAASAERTEVAEDHGDDLYLELMGEEDEVDEFFLLEGSSCDGDPLVLRVMGRPDRELAWVH